MLKKFFILLLTGFLATAFANAQKPVLSTAGENSWYHVVSAYDGTLGMVMTDNSATQSDFPIGVEAAQEGLASQQWKLVQADEEGKLVYLVNRNTGNILQPFSEDSGLYRVTQLNNSVETGMGFTLTGLGRGQYAFVGTEGDGQKRGLVALQKGKPVEEGELEFGSPYAWTFQFIDFDTNVNSIHAERPVIFVKDGRIIVNGNNEYRVMRVDGVEIPQNSRLVPGIYIVKTEEYTVKVIINK